MENFELGQSVIDLLKEGASYLEKCGVSEARAEADFILAHILNKTRDKLYLDRERLLTPAIVEQFWCLVRQRGARVPLAYILKTREFMGLNFYVDPNVLIPRPETELLVEKALMLIQTDFPGQTVRILDLCTGSGAIAVSLAVHCRSAAIVATDISEQALAVARYNAQQHKVWVDFRQGNLFAPVQGQKFDLILSNPPYVSKDEYLRCSPEVKKEPALALLGGEDGLDFYRYLAMESDEYLTPAGMIIVEIGNLQGLKVVELFSQQGYKTEIFPDYAGWDRIVLARKEYDFDIMRPS
ncbi:MAG: peptide chain release factor N(5)-glutamine methyltransferase [Peptococcaceae bacterium]|jgi:release factor glutamine methyltransferase|nr:peptide chain release factor N(5)-glutamine methyltransferase [Peptococcaceae bacterium]